MGKKKLNEVQPVNSLKDSEYILVTMEDGSIGRIKKSELMPFNGCEHKSFTWVDQGWYRIAYSIHTARMNAAIFNIGNTYNTSKPLNSCFYLAGSGYELRIVNKIGQIGDLFNKVRFVYKEIPNTDLYIDIYYNSSRNNNIWCSISNSLNLRLITPFIVNEESLNGYLIEEFEL
ncbi:MAG: hypothetical protein LUF85_04155 [Bacteroides sp.]|nr:hypothetical protein [Bacteroides sp.]